ncbi:MAG: cyclopropane-fatty-acyl-phospholipid synthase family protein, partial [Sphingomonadales bacterium]
MRLLNAMLSRFVEKGTLRVIDAGGALHSYGGGNGPEVTLRLHDAKLERTLLFKPELKIGEAYMDGSLTVEEGTIRDLLLIFAINRDNLRAQPLQKALRGASKRLRAVKLTNTLKRSRANVAHHYDLSNDLYRLFLDDGLNYSCAYFEDPGQSLEEAQLAKLRHIAAKLDLAPGQRVLDIGCGWGSMALYMAKVMDVEVLGVTLSEEQLELARERAKAAGLDGRVRFELLDYRALGESFDRIVSIGMFEHVGVGRHLEFFNKVRDLLTDDGVALLHSIGRSGAPAPVMPWLRKYIVPGSYSPAMSETFAAVELSGLRVTDVEILRRHYAETLLHWSKRFGENRAEAAELFDERF